MPQRSCRARVAGGLNALSGIGGVQTLPNVAALTSPILRLNALSGIGGVQTKMRLEAVEKLG